MLAAVLKEVDGLVLEDVPIPEPGLGEVVVRHVVEGGSVICQPSGFCGACALESLPNT